MPITTTGFATEFITFSRGSLATVTDSNGYIKWAPHNLLLASEQFDASTWTAAGSGVTIGANSTAAPNGTTTADALTGDGSAASHFIGQNVTLSSSDIYRVSVYVKANGVNFVQFFLGGGAGYANFNVTSGSPAAGNSGAPFGSLSVTDVGGGWYLCTATLTNPANNGVYIGLCNSATAPRAVVFTTSSGLYLWGAHLYRSDLGGMQANASAYPYYNPSTPKNLLGYSEAFATSGPWFTDDVTIASNVATAPNGSQTADSITDNTVSSAHLIVQSVAVAAGTYTFSIYAKASTWGILQVAFGSAAAGRVNFNLSSGSLGSSDHTSSITLVGDGWYRCAVTVAPTAGTLEIYLAIVTSSTAARLESFSGTGARTLLLWGAQLSDSASLDPYVGSYGAAPSAAAAYGPRLDYDPVTLAARGLLVEETRTNLLLRSNEFDDVNWNKFNSTLTTNAATAPDGSATADLIVPNTTAGVPHSIYQSVTVSAVAYTLSVYAKAGGYPAIKVANLFTGVGATFNISTGVVGTADAGVTQAIRSVGNGWYRCEITFTASAGSTLYGVYVQSALGTSVYAGDGTSGVYLYGMQLEAGAFATSYIPTAAATVTRNADVASVATSQFPYSVSEGTLVAKGIFIAPADAGVSVMASLDNGSSGESINIYRQSNLVYLNIFDNSGPAQAQWAVSGTTNLSTAAIAYKTNDIGAAVNGTSQTPDTSATLPTVDRLNIGRMWGGAFGANGHIQQITYIPRRLSSSELVARTA